MRELIYICTQCGHEERVKDDQSLKKTVKLIHVHIDGKPYIASDMCIECFNKVVKDVTPKNDNMTVLEFNGLRVRLC